MYLLDTDGIIRALGAFEPAARTVRSLAGLGIHISIVSVGEIYERAFNFAYPQAHVATFWRLMEDYAMLNLSEPIMERFAEIRATCAAADK